MGCSSIKCFEIKDSPHHKQHLYLDNISTPERNPSQQPPHSITSQHILERPSSKEIHYPSGKTFMLYDNMNLEQIIKANKSII